MNWTTVLIVAVILVTLDKGITVLNIRAVEKNYPQIDAYSIEKNPIARASFHKYGLFGGTLIYWAMSILTFLFAVWLFHYPAKLFAPNNAYGVALYAVMLLYAFVVMNNFYFLLRYSKVL